MRKYKPLQLGIVLRMIITMTLSFSFFSVLSVKTGDSHPFLVLSALLGLFGGLALLKDYGNIRHYGNKV